MCQGNGRRRGRENGAGKPKNSTNHISCLKCVKFKWLVHDWLNVCMHVRIRTEHTYTHVTFKDIFITDNCLSLTLIFYRMTLSNKPYKCSFFFVEWTGKKSYGISLLLLLWEFYEIIFSSLYFGMTDIRVALLCSFMTLSITLSISVERKEAMGRVGSLEEWIISRECLKEKYRDELNE